MAKNRPFEDFILKKFNGPEPMNREEAEQVFTEYSALGLIDMVRAADRQGGLTPEIILEHAPDELDELPDGEQREEFERFWQFCVFLTVRYKWKKLPDMGMPIHRKRARGTAIRSKTGRKKKSKASKRHHTHYEGSIAEKFINKLGGERKALAEFDKLRGEHGSRAKVMKKLKIPGLTLGNLHYILATLKKKSNAPA